MQILEKALDGKACKQSYEFNNDNITLRKIDVQKNKYQNILTHTDWGWKA